VPRLRLLPSRLRSGPPRLTPPKLTDRFYSSPEWKRLVQRRKLDGDWFAAKRRAKPGERLILDHIIERKDGGLALDPANTQWLTMSEHQVKTAKARAARAAGSPARGVGQKSGGSAT
jgi:5-methylcytosine-specific restriction protein A